MKDGLKTKKWKTTLKNGKKMEDNLKSEMENKPINQINLISYDTIVFSPSFI
jgi:hypothetical protein